HYFGYRIAFRSFARAASGERGSPGRTQGSDHLGSASSSCRPRPRCRADRPVADVAGRRGTLRPHVDQSRANQSRLCRGEPVSFQTQSGRRREARTTAFFDRAQQSLSALPGVRSVALTQYPLLSGGSWVSSFTIPGHPNEGGRESTAHMLTVSETFFTTLGVPVLLGRDLHPGDAVDAPKAVVVNEAFARKFFPGEYPVGQTLKRDDDNWQIVGVCREIKYAHIK